MDLDWQGISSGCLRAFFFEDGLHDEMGIADGTLINPTNAEYRDWDWILGEMRYLNFFGLTAMARLGNALDIRNLAAFTISARINPTTDGGSDKGCIFSKYTADGQILFYLDATSAGKTCLHVMVACATTNAEAQSTYLVNLGAQSHVAATWDDATKTVKLFLNGVECAYTYNITGVGAQKDDSADYAFIGNVTSATWGFDGGIDTFILHGRVLNADELLWLANTGYLDHRWWRAYGAYGKQIASPHSVTLDGEFLLVSSSGTNQLKRFLKRPLSLWHSYLTAGSGDGQTIYPGQTAVDGPYVYLADTDNNRVQKLLRKDLSFIAKAGSLGAGDGQFNNPRGIALDPLADRLYVSDYLNDRIQVLKKSDLSFIAKQGTTGSGNLQLYRPVGLHYDSVNDRLYIADGANNRIMVWKGSDLSYLAKFGSLGSGNGQFNWPHGLCLNADFVFVADTYNNRIQKFEISGFAYHSHVGTIGVGHDQMYHPAAVALDGPYLSIVEDLGCRLQLRLADSLEYVRMSWDVLDDNTGSASLINTSAGYYQLFYKLHTLAALDYALFFLAYDAVSPYGQLIDGSVLTPFASTGSDNQVTDVTYTWLYSGVYLCCAKFTGTAATWKVGLQLEPLKQVRVTLPRYVTL